ncbi:MAG: TetR/AcrR family transcriptional regulator [Magnetospirillum sp.]|jgi:AcrR family transcriptional regulator|nr:TetR/AcrR family transcriptional regulator [Magnetospirillum sp.]
MASPLSTRAPAGAKRLDSAAWVAAAFEALAAEGIGGVRVERLAATLGVTKGSFYWHFKDREALVVALLERWAAGRIAAIAEQTRDYGSEGAARKALLALLDIYARTPNRKGLAVELAIRGLAPGHAAAKRAVARVDAARLAKVGALFAKLGKTPAEADARALLFYAFLFGQSLMGGGKRLAAAKRAAAKIVAD